MKKRNITLMLLMAAAAAAFDGGISGPVSGMVFLPEEGAIRPVLGVPGSAWLGEPLASGLDLASVAPDGKRAVAARNGRLYEISLNGIEAVRWRDIGAAPEGLNRVVWSADASAAAIVSSARGAVQVFRGGEVTPSCSLPGAVLSAAIDGSGNVAAGVEGEGLYLCRDGAARLVSRNPKVSAIAITGQDLYLTDGTLGQLMAIRGYKNEGDATVMAAVEDPVGLAVSGDGTRLAVASGASRAVTVFDLATAAAVQTVELEFTPTGADRFSGAALWLLNRGAQGPLQLLELSREVNVYFVPAGRGDQ